LGKPGLPAFGWRTRRICGDPTEGYGGYQASPNDQQLAHGSSFGFGADFFSSALLSLRRRCPLGQAFGLLPLSAEVVRKLSDRIHMLRPAVGLAIDFVLVPDRGQSGAIVRRVRDGRLRTNIGNIATLDDALVAFNPTERISGKTIICVRP